MIFDRSVDSSSRQELFDSALQTRENTAILVLEFPLILKVDYLSSSAYLGHRYPEFAYVTDRCFRFLGCFAAAN